MQQLHLVGLTTDSDKIICSARKGAKSGGFVLPLDEHLLQVIAEAVTRRKADGIELEVPEALQPPAAAPRRQSHLSPREIQDRLRAGRSLEEIAVEAGVGEEWVARFAAPVEAERSQVVGRARRLTYDRPRRGISGEPLGMAVRWNLADRGVRLTNDEFDAAWSAYQLADSAWMVTFQYESRKRLHEAEWEVDLATDELVSRNRLATELGYVEPGRRRRAMATLQPAASPSALRARASAVAAGANVEDEDDDRPRVGAKRPPAKKAARRSTTASKRPAAKKTSTAKKASATKKASPAKRPAAKKSPPARSAANNKKAPTRPTKATTRGTSKTTAKRTTKRAPAKKAAGRSTTRRTGRGVPPAPVATSGRAAMADDRPVPNELGRRRLQLVSGTASTARPPIRPASPGRPAPATSGVRIAAARSGDVAAAPLRERPAEPPVRRLPVAEQVAPPEPVLDVRDGEAEAEARRAERRRARAAARAGASSSSSSPRTAASGATADTGDDDGRVVMIRANRASPPRGDAEVVLPTDRPSLRPAQPATQPRKRRFNRTDR